MGVAAAGNIFDVFNTSRLLLKAAKTVQLAALQVRADTKTMNKPCCVYSAEFANSLVQYTNGRTMY